MGPVGSLGFEGFTVWSLGLGVYLQAEQLKKNKQMLAT